MPAIVHSEEPIDLGGVWLTFQTDSDGTRTRYYEEHATRGMCGSRNQATEGDVRPGRLAPNCIVCHERGYCKAMCPVGDIPGFTCTISMNAEDQEADWQVGEHGWTA